MDIITTLPDEIILNIMTNLDPLVVTSLCQSSKRFTEISKDETLWKYYLIRDYGAHSFLFETPGFYRDKYILTHKDEQLWKCNLIRDYGAYTFLFETPGLYRDKYILAYNNKLMNDKMFEPLYKLLVKSLGHSPIFITEGPLIIYDENDPIYSAMTNKESNQLNTNDSFIPSNLLNNIYYQVAYTTHYNRPERKSRRSTILTHIPHFTDKVVPSIRIFVGKNTLDNKTENLRKSKQLRNNFKSNNIDKHLQHLIIGGIGYVYEFYYGSYSNKISRTNKIPVFN